MEEELFKIKSRFGDFPSYRVTRSGKVFSYRQGNILKPLSVVLDSSGYPIVKLYNDIGKPRTIAVHRLIADTFIPNVNNLECINHKDENKTNNSVENLEWCTKAYNNCYNNKAIKIGLKLRDSSPRKRAVNQIDENGIIINTYKSIREAARCLGNVNADSNIYTGIQRHQKRYGYYWEYANV
jgi:hypothetical protein